MRSLALSAAVLLATAYVVFAGAMYVAQRSFVYLPGSNTFEVPAKFQLAGFEEVSIGTDDGETLAGWYGAPPNDTAPTIVYLHGNAGTLGDRAERFRRFHAEGYGVLAISWRGYGGSTGLSTEDGLMADGRGALKFLKDRGIGPERTILFGESLGAGVAVPLAADAATRPAALVLDSPFTSAADMARLRYWFLPVNLLMKDQYRSDLAAPKVTVPVFTMHGTEDRVTPYAFGEKLSGMFGGKSTFLRLDGAGHIADLTPHSWGAIKAFLAENGLAAE